MTDPRRIVVTGMGMITAIGNDVPSTWSGLVAGRSGISTIDAFDPSRLNVRIAAQVHDFDPSHVMDRKEIRRTDRYIQFGLVASREAMDQAGLPERLEGTLAEETGAILGTGLGGVGTLTDGISINALRGPDRISPFLVPMGIPNVGAGQIAINFGMTGPNFATVSACASGGHAIGEASEIIRRGDAEMMLAGGSEAGICEPLVGGFAAMRALSTRNDDPERASRPFDSGRDGFVCGEGAAVLVLEGRDATCGTHRLRRHGRCVAHHPAGARWHRGGPGRPSCAREGRHHRRGHRPYQCSRDLDAGGRQGRTAGDPDDPR
jgi:3-oxoacyl-[acyl-carrier-protein] synthase II